MSSIPTLHVTDSEQKRKEIKGYFKKADPLRHSIIFYYGHTATFFINKFKLVKITDTKDILYVIQETVRKHQSMITQRMIWQKRKRCLSL